MKDSFGKEISRRGFIARVDQDFMPMWREHS